MLDVRLRRGLADSGMAVLERMRQASRPSLSSCHLGAPTRSRNSNRTSAPSKPLVNPTRNLGAKLLSHGLPDICTTQNSRFDGLLIGENQEF
jgi:hypothetical protein